MKYDEIIKRSGKSLKQIQDETGISHAQLYRIRAGTSEPTAGVIVKLCKCLNCTADELLGIEETPSGSARRGKESTNKIEQSED